MDSYTFAKLGFDVTGVDYSSEMIEAAKNLKDIPNKPRFEVLDMRDLSEHFSPNSFDAAFIFASLIHIPEEDVPGVLTSVHNITVNGGKVFIALKGGVQGPKIVVEDRYIKGIEREFIFWEEKNFVNLVESLGFIVLNKSENSNAGLTAGKPTQWLKFELEVAK